MHQSAVTSTNTTLPSATNAAISVRSKARQAPGNAATVSSPRNDVASKRPGTTNANMAIPANAGTRIIASWPPWPRHNTNNTASNNAASTTTPAGAICAARIDSSHAAVPASAKPSAKRNQTIHTPGRGIICAKAGNAATARYGSASPSPSARNTANISNGPRASAKPTAVPRNGAEHGVASSVASAPVTNAPLSEGRCDRGAPAVAAASAIGSGSRISNQPHKLAANSVTTSAMKMRNA